MSTETLHFKTELKQLLHLIIHSLYSHKDIFLRELISNASDAIDTIRFQGLTHPELLEGNDNWKIKIIPDEATGTLTISDNGVGMSRDTIVDHLGTIARSGTREFIEALKKADAKERPELIGQFGVGFYSSFMVADKVTVISRMAGPAAQGVKWESTGQGDFTVEEIAKEQRGTDVILHLRAEDKEFLQPWRLRALVKKYSDFVAHPIVMDVEKEEEGKKTTTEETLNARQALWLRPKADITPAEYTEFYQHITHDSQEPLKTIHYAAEGAIEFKALLYLPRHRPYDLRWGDSKKGLHLYIQRVFIMDDCETLLPRYLRFIRGVVDSPDLPLNVSRELLQQSAPLEKIKNNLANKVLNSLDEMKRKEFADYVTFFAELGVFLKEGVNEDWSNREKIADLLLWQSTQTEPGKYTTLGEYLERMPVGQKEIYFLTGESRELMEQSPYLESSKAKGQEVLLLDDPIDDFVVQSLPEYKGKKLKAVNRGELEEIAADKKQQYQSFLTFLKEKLPEVKEVRLSQRLKESAVCLVGEEWDLSPHVERLIKRMGKEHTAGQRILEINGDHPTVLAIRQLFEREPQETRLEKYVRILYDQAVIAEGSKVQDPLAFSQRINDLLAKDAAT